MARLGHLATVATRTAQHPLVKQLQPWAIDLGIVLVLGVIGTLQLLDRAPGPFGPGGPFDPRRGGGPGFGPRAVFEERALIEGLGTQGLVRLLWLATLPLLVRSQAPMFALGGVTLFGTFFSLASVQHLPFLPVMLAALYSVAASAEMPRLPAMTIAAASAAVMLEAMYLASPGGVDALWTMNVAWVAAALLLGDAMRSRRAATLAAEQRALDAERSREEHALRRVSEERLEIARELHDVVAHNIALINVQAGVAAHLRERDPERVQAAFETIKEVSHATLEEMRAMVGVLRESRDASEGVPTARLDGLDRLVDSVRAAGVDVTFEVRGQSRPVPATVDISAYRLLQEALTNAVRYGDGAVNAAIEYGPDALAIEVTNRIGPALTERGSGHGIEGMRERTFTLGGTFEAGPVGDRWVMRASLPLAA